MQRAGKLGWSKQSWRPFPFSFSFPFSSVSAKSTSLSFRASIHGMLNAISRANSGDVQYLFDDLYQFIILGGAWAEVHIHAYVGSVDRRGYKRHCLWCSWIVSLDLKHCTEATFFPQIRLIRLCLGVVQVPRSRDMAILVSPDDRRQTTDDRRPTTRLLYPCCACAHAG
jgi:hypothetical protein